MIRRQAIEYVARLLELIRRDERGCIGQVRGDLIGDRKARVLDVEERAQISGAKLKPA